MRSKMFGEREAQATEFLIACEIAEIGVTHRKERTELISNRVKTHALRSQIAALR